MTVFWRLVLPLVLLGCVAEGAPIQVSAAFHVHTSSFSTGELSLEELIREAQRKRIGALILTENLLLRFEYGLFPLRGVVRRVVERPSLAQTGVEAYLRALDAAQARFPDVILVPGVEVVPYYYWTGSLFTRDLTMWEGQKNLLIVGLSRPEDYERLPVIGSSRSSAPGVEGFLKLALGLVAMIGGVGLLRRRRERAVRLTHFTVRVQKRYRAPGWMALAVGGLLAADAVASPALNPYRGNLGVAPYQAVIDAAESRGGMAFWSFPEARDLSQESVGRLGTVTIRTDPYPDALLQSHGYTGFGAIYPDTTTVTEPGRQWDRLLGEYARGRRSRPAWGIGELGYHGPPKPLDEALTILWVPERSRPAVLRSLRDGRFYAVRPRSDFQLRLDDLSIGQEGSTGWAPMGGELAATGPERILVRLRLSASDGRAVPVSARLIRDGRVVAEVQGTTPFEAVVPGEPPAPGAREFVRLEATQPHWLLSNPVFVRRAP
ncbi:MAG TPA: hypothetical protein VGW35_02515 [Methylomirabilota bacterium]|nr:hypothetical protein [Methylomirabilota bacterium]